MPIRINRSTLTFLVAVALTALVTACATNRAGREQKGDIEGPVTLEQMTSPARSVIQQLTEGGKIDSILREVEKGRTVYDVEVTFPDRHMEFTVAADGEVVGLETSIDYSKLPEAVRLATEKYFGSSAGLSPSKGVEDGQITYEIDGTKDGKKVAARFDSSGKLVGEEK